MLSPKLWKNKTVLITGASGFVGRWLTKELLSYKTTVYALTNNKRSASFLKKSLNNKLLNITVGDINDIEFLVDRFKLDNIEIIFHLAASNNNRDVDDLFTLYDTNIRCSYSILEFSRLQGQQFAGIILTSSCKTLLFNKYFSSVNANFQPYDFSKICTELIGRSFSDNYSMNVSIVRPENIYGGGDFNWERIIPSTIKSIYFSKYPVIINQSNTERNYIYIEDVIKSYLLIAESISTNKFACYNLGTNYFTSTLDLIRLIFKYMKVKPNVVINDSNSSEKLQKCNENNYKYVSHNYNFVKINVGLKKTIAWYSAYFDS